MDDLLAEARGARERFLALVAEIRPELHRYCARMTGSVIDGEDVVQDTLAKAYYQISMADELPPLRPWLFRIAHNTAIDVLRRYERRHVELVAEVPDDDAAPLEEIDHDVVHAALVAFLALPVAQRSAVILKDVLGCSLAEIAETTGASVQAVKALLVRGRAALRARAGTPPPRRPAAAAPPGELVGHYVKLFNAHDWDGVRALVAEECRLDLVSRLTRRGKSVGEYFTRYADERHLRAVPGWVEGRPAVGVLVDPAATRPDYFILLEETGGRIALIRDYRYARYVVTELALTDATF